MAEQNRWKREEKCRPVCFWRQFGSFASDMLDLWGRVMQAEVYLEGEKAPHRKRVRFFVGDWAAVTEMRLGGHPAYGHDGWADWEISALLREVAGWFCSNPGAEAFYLRGR